MTNYEFGLMVCSTACLTDMAVIINKIIDDAENKGVQTDSVRGFINACDELKLYKDDPYIQHKLERYKEIVNK